MKPKHNEEAISPVVGVILMIAITIILAVVITSFIIGDAGEQKEQHFATIKAQHMPSGDIALTLYNDDFQETIEAYHVTINNVTRDDFNVTSVGQSKHYKGPFNGQRNTVLVTAKYADGTENPVLNVMI